MPKLAATKPKPASAPATTPVRSGGAGPSHIAKQTAARSEKAKLAANTFAGCPVCFGPWFALFQARPNRAGEYHIPPSRKLEIAATNTAQIFIGPCSDNSRVCV